MLKKRTGKRKPPAGRARPKLNKATVAAVVVLCLVAGGASVSRRESLRRGLRLSPAAVIASPTPTPLTWAKDYVYAGGRLVATEEPAATGPGPASLVATATGTTQVTLVWAGVAGSHHYEIERRDAGGITSAATGDAVTAFTDNGAVPGTSYLYRVRAVFAGGDVSNYSTPDLATTIIFSDDPLCTPANQSTCGPPTQMKAEHITQLRQAVDAVRTLAGAGPASWAVAPGTGPAQAGATIYADHVLKLRENLAPALAALGLPPDGYSEALMPNSTRIRGVHITELRDRVR